LIDRLQIHRLRLAGFQSRQVVTRRGRLHVLDAPGRGTLPPVLLLHGLGSAAADYAPLLRRLRRHVRRVVALDLFGHGASDAMEPGTPVRDLVDSVLEAIDQVVDEPMVVFGNSMGGLAAVRVARSRPALVRALVLASPGGAPMDADALEEFLRGFRLDTHAAAVEFLERCLGEPGWSLHPLAWGTRRRFGRPEVRSLLDAVAPGDLLSPDDVRSLRMPILVLWGDRDRVLPSAHRAFFQENLPPHAHFEEPRGFGHAPQLDSPAAVTRRLVAWIGAATLRSVVR
jgi:pimeloyl-ACP methyl ester carboxylesterase